MTVLRLDDSLLVVRADNPSPMTGTGTNTYIVGKAAPCIIDPGPDDPQHLENICKSLSGFAKVAAILVTHAHRDHSALAPRLGRHLGVPVMAFGAAEAGRSPLMQALADQDLAGGGEGVDPDFRPDHCLSPGMELQFGPETLTALWTPGHMGNHMCFLWRDRAFTGDHVMGWSTSLVSPPDGDLSAFMASLTLLENQKAQVLYPGHGAPVTDPAHRIATLRAHRLTREAQILGQLDQGPATIAQLVRAIYVDLAPSLHPAAARNVHAHLISLWEKGGVSCDGLPSDRAEYRRT